MLRIALNAGFATLTEYYFPFRFLGTVAPLMSLKGRNNFHDFLFSGGSKYTLTPLGRNKNSPWVSLGRNHSNPSSSVKRESSTQSVECYWRFEWAICHCSGLSHTLEHI